MRFLAVCLVILDMSFNWADVPIGIIVETVAKGSLADKAGIVVGDVILTYDNQPLLTPISLLACEENSFGKDNVEVRLRQVTVERLVNVPLGSLGVTSRPQLTPHSLASYLLAREAKLDAAGGLFEKAAEEEGKSVGAAWLLLRSAAAWHAAGHDARAHVHNERAVALFKELEDSAGESRARDLLNETLTDQDSTREDNLRRRLAIDDAAGRSIWEAWSMNALGNLAWRHGDVDGAEAWMRKALEIREVKAPDSLDLAASYNNLGAAAWARKDLPAAEQWYRKALAIRERKAPGTTDVAACYTNLGVIAEELKDFPGAGAWYRRALSIQESIAPDSLALGAIYNNLGNVARDIGDQHATGEWYKKDLAIVERKAPDSLDLATTYKNLGAWARLVGDTRSSDEWYLKATTILDRKAPDSLDLATIYNNLGQDAEVRGDLKDAEEWDRKALAIWQKNDSDGISLGGGYNNLGNVAADRGDFQAADQWYRRALVIWESKLPESLELSLIYNNLGTNADTLGDLKASDAWHRKSLAIRESKAPGSIDLAYTYNNLASVANDRGDLGAADDWNRKSLDIWERQAPGSIELSRSYNNIGVTASHRGNMAVAEMRFRQALEIRKVKAPDSLDLAVSYDNLGILALRRGEIRQSEVMFGKAWRIVRRQSNSAVGDESRQSFAVNTILIGERLVRSQCLLSLATAFTTLQEMQAQALRQVLTDRVLSSKAKSSPNYRRYQDLLFRKDRLMKHAEQDSIRQIVAKREGRATDASDLKARYDLELAEATQTRVEAESLAREIKRQSPEVFVPELTTAQLQKSLPPHSLYLGYAVTPDGPVVIAIGRKWGPKTYVINLKEDSLRRLVDRVQVGLAMAPGQNARGVKSITNTKPATNLEADLQTLGKILIPKALGPMVLNAKRIIITPDGPLWNVPFAAFRVNGTYLGLSIPITYTPSIALFARSAAQPSPRGRGACVLGGAYFTRSQSSAKNDSPDRSARSYLWGSASPPPYLPGTSVEAKSVAALYGVKPLIGEEASEANLRTKLAGARVIHLATHGYLNELIPMSSGLLLTVPKMEPKEDETDDDGALQAWEIAGELHLSADLVVLSACETGQGKNVRGEGIVGLTRSLTFAGARSVVASLWQVSDASTADLMVAFHRNRKLGKATDEALRLAMVETAKKHPHPYYWAPFTLTGDWR